MSPARTEAWLVEFVLGSRPTELNEAAARGLLEVQASRLAFDTSWRVLPYTARFRWSVPPNA